MWIVGLVVTRSYFFSVLLINNESYDTILFVLSIEWQINKTYIAVIVIIRMQVELFGMKMPPYVILSPFYISKKYIQIKC